MIIDQKIFISKYRCFEKEVQIEKIYPINIIIGKNNSGKSTLLNVIECLVTLEHTALPNDAKVSFEYTLRKETFNKSIKDVLKIIPPENLLGKRVIVNSLTKEISLIPKKNIDIDIEDLPRPNPDVLVYDLSGKSFQKINAERDIRSNTSSAINFNGNGEYATNFIYTIYNNRDKRDLITQDLLDDINQILKPDFLFKEIFVAEAIKTKSYFEVYFKLENGKNVALSEMGTGNKVIILVLLHTLILPKFESKNPSEYVFAFEELENNLHPAVVRRLFNYILNYSIKNKAYFFITTHSSIVIDIFNSNENAQILHLKNETSQSTITPINSQSQAREILDDLDIRASDILQSNGIIWVEGPSDKTYINHWISLTDNSIKEHVHYNIMFYGGKLLSHLSFDNEFIEQDLIPLLKLNRNAIVVMDRDGNTSDDTVNKTKTRIEKEIGKKNCWITKGREIENYLTPETLKKWLKIPDFKCDCNEKLESQINYNLSNLKKDYASKKTKYAREITKSIEYSDLDILDLKDKTSNLIKEIKRWNNIS